jgi:hypothetical protein
MSDTIEGQLSEQEPGADEGSVEEVDAVAPQGRVQSVRDRLKQKREDIGAQTEITMEIPGYDGELQGEFKRMRWEAMADVADRAEKSKAKRGRLNGQADVIATACAQLIVREELPGGEIKDTPLNEMFPDEFGDAPVRFDARLADWLGLELEGTPTARKVVFAVFNNDLAVTAMHNELGEWMQSSKSEEDETFTTR